MNGLGKNVSDDLFAQIEKRAFPEQEAAKAKEKAEARDHLKHLSAARYSQRDFFIADVVDANPRDDIMSMEHPIFALKAGDRRVREYERNGSQLKIKPGYDGCATIHDKDVWIYCISQLVEALNQDRPDVNRTIRFTAYDFMTSTNRRTDGRAYEQFTAAMARLKGTTLETNIEVDNYREKAGFGLVDSWRVIEKDGKDRMVAVEVTLPDWLFRAIKSKQVLAIHRDYFRLRKPLDRRVYELCRKHCGTQDTWRIGLKTLHEKTGSTAPLRNFKVAIKSLADTGELPGYSLSLKDDMVTVRSDPTRRIMPGKKPKKG